jgi:hypothetical protein
MEKKQSAEVVIPEPTLDKATQRRLRTTVKNLLSAFEYQVLRGRRIKSCSQHELLQIEYVLSKLLDSNFNGQFINRLYPIMLSAQNRIAAIAVERKRNRRKTADSKRFYEARNHTRAKTDVARDALFNDIQKSGYAPRVAEYYAARAIPKSPAPFEGTPPNRSKV